MTAAARRGTTTVADKVVRKIAEQAAGEALPGPAAGRASGSASVHGRRASVALRLPLPYPAPLSDTARRVQRHVTDRTGELTGLGVAPARLTVTRLTVPSQPAAPGVSGPAPTSGSGTAIGSAATAGSGTTPGPPAGEVPADEMPTCEVPASGPSAAARRAPRRWWSARRAPAAVLTLSAAAGCAAVTADVVRVHVAHRPAAAWRTRTVEWLSVHGPGEVPVVVGSAVVAVLGLWMLVLALTPGRRHRFTLAAATPVRNVAVDRSTVAALLRDTVGDVEGVAAVRVRVGRHRATVRAALAFGDRGQAHEQAASAAHAVLADCLLRRTPRLRVRLTPEPTWQPPDSAPPPSSYGPAAAPPGPGADSGPATPSDPTAPAAPAPSSEPADGTGIMDATGSSTGAESDTDNSTASPGGER
ncbi:DUF6286 domain-containing Asp23/Gls24 family envelope stress response protein [Streptomyces sp. WMMB303]|uniref:DUF6286 domain-containing Asp23/Gls24 family envelope stress response protein n=1 Tax=Streptomyces sp. WMMB303 TaxID=3034154 RepID=UPI0023EE1FC6|nr:DUF6286 domain-containing Asp23/Gls24 family envelope stress response protein [Streptomyces sp. WMMB303]MDF4254400.1 DUF6286 domain-containing protein [Streptomyces sp. WMMB303]